MFSLCVPSSGASSSAFNRRGPSILQQIQTGLQIQTPLTAELYALNVCQKGGHFVKHKDTPRGPDMVGTLVVNLPGCYYEGGGMEFSAENTLEKPKVFLGARQLSSFVSSSPAKMWSGSAGALTARPLALVA